MNKRSCCSLIIFSILCFLLIPIPSKSTTDLPSAKIITLSSPIDSSYRSYNPANIEFMGLPSSHSNDSIIAVYSIATSYLKDREGNAFPLSNMPVFLDTISCDRNVYSSGIWPEEMKKLYLGSIDSVLVKNSVLTGNSHIHGPSYFALRSEFEYDTKVCKFKNNRFFIYTIKTWGESSSLIISTILFCCIAAVLGYVLAWPIKRWASFYKNFIKTKAYIFLILMLLIVGGIVTWLFNNVYNTLPGEFVITHTIILCMAFVLFLLIGLKYIKRKK